MRKIAPLCTVLTLSAALAAGSPAQAWPWGGGERTRPAPRPAAPAGFPDIGYADWTDQEPDYRLYPGDTVDITVPSAPELTKTGVIVQPDGRVTMPLIAPVMAADRTIPELQDALTRAYASQLLRSQVVVTMTAATPLKVFVGGEVGTPGVFDMPGDINSLQAIIQAGGLKPSAKSGQVVIIRRGSGGQAMMRTVNLKQAMQSPASADFVPLRRFDIVYVPRSNVAEVGLWVQQWFRDLSPVQFSYALNGQYNN
ncbi:MAG: polysaccharide biosynthesis/export family protein [Caulobacter sp.]|nr:polysaccharide biosynthesis/export family protein [Caulobacter sp.]